MVNYNINLNYSDNCLPNVKTTKSVKTVWAIGTIHLLPFHLDSNGFLMITTKINVLPLGRKKNKPYSFESCGRQRFSRTEAETLIFTIVLDVKLIK